MATHSSTLARKIPWTEEPSGLQSMASQRVDTMEHICTKWPVVSYGKRPIPVSKAIKAAYVSSALAGSSGSSRPASSPLHEHAQNVNT